MLNTSYIHDPSNPHIYHAFITIYPEIASSPPLVDSPIPPHLPSTVHHPSHLIFSSFPEITGLATFYYCLPPFHFLTPDLYSGVFHSTSFLPETQLPTHPPTACATCGTPIPAIALQYSPLHSPLYHAYCTYKAKTELGKSAIYI